MPVGRIGTPEDIAHAAVFLMTSRQTTGAVLEVSGGETPRRHVGADVILVTGATGNVGGEVAAALAAAGEPVRAVVRDPARAARCPPASRSSRATSSCPSRSRPRSTGRARCSCSAAGATCRGSLRRIGGAGVEHVVLLTSRCVVGGRPDNAITRMWLDSEAAVREAGRRRGRSCGPAASSPTRCAGCRSCAAATSCARRGPTSRSPRSTPPTSRAVAAAALTEPGTPVPRYALSGPEPLTPGGPGRDARRRRSGGRCATSRSPTSEARAEMAPDTPAPYIDAFFRFYSRGRVRRRAGRRHGARGSRGARRGRLRAVGAPPRRRVRIARRPLSRRAVATSSCAQPRGVGEQVDLDDPAVARR